MSSKVEVKKRAANIVWRNDGSFRVDNVRLSFPHLDKAYAQRNEGQTDAQFEGAKKFSLCAMMNKDTHQAAHDMIQEIIRDALSAQKDVRVAKKDYFIKDGDDSGRDEYVNYWTLNARESRRPVCRKPSGTVMEVDEIADTFYAGCYVNILVKPWVQNNAYGKKINLNLVAVQFVKDGEQIGEGRVNDEDAFETVAEDDDEFDGV